MRFPPPENISWGGLTSAIYQEPKEGEVEAENVPRWGLHGSPGSAKKSLLSANGAGCLCLVSCGNELVDQRSWSVDLRSCCNIYLLVWFLFKAFPACSTAPGKTLRGISSSSSSSSLALLKDKEGPALNLKSASHERKKGGGGKRKTRRHWK